MTFRLSAFWILTVLLAPAVLRAGDPLDEEMPDPPEVDIQKRIEARAARMGTSEMASKYAAEKLIEIGKPAVPKLIEMTGDKNKLTRMWSVYALARIGDERGTDAVIDLLDDPVALVRSVTAYRGSQMKIDRVHRAIFDRLDEERSGSVLAWIVRGLSEAGYKPIDEKLPPLLDHDNPLLRAHAADALARMRPAGYAPLVADRLARESDPNVVRHLLSLLVKSESLRADVMDGLFGVLSTDNPGILMRAAAGLRKAAQEAQTRLNESLKVDPKQADVDLLKAVNTLGKELARFSPRDRKAQQQLAAAGWRQWWTTHREAWAEAFGPFEKKDEKADPAGE